MPFPRPTTDPRDREDLEQFAGHLLAESAAHPGWPDLKLQLAHVRWKLAAVAAPERLKAPLAREVALLLGDALEQNPRYLSARVSVYALALARGDEAAARAQAALLAAEHGASLEAKVARALLVLALGRPSEARALLAGAPADPGPSAIRPRLLALRALLATDDDNARARAEFVALYPALAEPFARGRFLGPPGRGSTLRRLALFLAERGEPARAALWLQRALDLDLDLGAHLATSGDLAFAAGETEAAVERLGRALEVAPELARARVTRAFALGVLDQADAARTELEVAVRAHPGYPDLRYHLGVLLADQGDAEGAARELAEAVRLHPAYLDALYALGLVRAGQADDAGALDAFGRAHAGGLDHEELRLELAFAHLFAGDRAEAARLFEQELEDARADLDPAASPRLGAALLAEGDGLAERARELLAELDLAADDTHPASALGAAARRRLALGRALADRLARGPRPS